MVLVEQGSEQDHGNINTCREFRRRLRDHAAGRISHTKNRRSLNLFYFGYQPDFTTARWRKKFSQIRCWTCLPVFLIVAGAQGTARVVEWQTQGT